MAESNAGGAGFAQLLAAGGLARTCEGSGFCEEAERGTEGKVLRGGRVSDFDSRWSSGEGERETRVLFVSGAVVERCCIGCNQIMN